MTWQPHATLEKLLLNLHRKKDDREEGSYENDEESKRENAKRQDDTNEAKTVQTRRELLCDCVPEEQIVVGRSSIN